MTEEWRAVPGYEHYAVSTLGRVRSPRCVLSPWRVGMGYRQVSLCRDARRKGFTIHRLVLLAFVGPPAEGQVCRHLDGNPANNVLTNLAWGSLSENVMDQVRHGTHRGARRTECPHGHPYDEANTYLTPGDGRRQCIACKQARRRAERSAA